MTVPTRVPWALETVPWALPLSLPEPIPRGHRTHLQGQVGGWFLLFILYWYWLLFLLPKRGKQGARGARDAVRSCVLLGESGWKHLLTTASVCLPGDGRQVPFQPHPITAYSRQLRNMERTSQRSNQLLDPRSKVLTFPSLPLQKEERVGKGDLDSGTSPTTNWLCNLGHVT